MKELGKMIFNMAMEKKAGQMEVFMKANTQLARNMEVAFINGMMALAMMDSGTKIK